MTTQAALAISLLRAQRTRWHRHGHGLLEDDAILGLDLDDVLLGADPRPPLAKGETQYRRRLREQKEAQEKAARACAALEEAVRQREEQWLTSEARWNAEAEVHRAAQQAAAAERVVQRQAKQKAEALERERLLTERWSNQAAERARFEALFSDEFVRNARQQGSVFDLCSLCNRPYWIQYDNLVNWSLYWKGPSRCYACYAPPLTDRVRRDHPEWTPLHVSHEIIMAIYGYGSYAQALELTSSRAWWIEHEHDYRDKEEGQIHE